MIEDILTQGLSQLGVPATGEEIARLDRYARLLLEQNQVMNLTAITEPEQVARLHMLDCAAVLAVHDVAGSRLIDVGTGAGFPGLVLKILEPSVHLTLLDSQRKRLDWLQEVCRELGLTEVVTVHGRAEVLGREPAYREQFDCATARAVAPLPELCELCLPLVRPGGWFLSMKGSDSAREVAEAGSAVEILGGETVSCETCRIPGAEVDHRLVRIRKVTATPPAYPRTFARIRRAPL